MDILNAMQKITSDIYFDPLFRQCVETYLPNLKSSPDIRFLDITETKAYQFEGDLRGLLISEGVPVEHIWIIMRMNDYRSYSEYDGKQYVLLLPPTNMINDIVQRYKTTHTVL